MKVEQKKAKFSPITITLETEKEAETLWYILACCDNESLKDYLKREKISSEKQGEIVATLDDIFYDYDNATTITFMTQTTAKGG